MLLLRRFLFHEVVVGYNKPRTHKVSTPMRAKIDHLVVRGTPLSVASQILKHPDYVSAMIGEIGKLLACHIMFK